MIRVGVAGIPGFYTATGVGTFVAHGTEERVFDRPYVLEWTITADFAIFKRLEGRLVRQCHRQTAQNSNPRAATAGRITVVEVEEIASPGELQPSAIHTPRRICRSANGQSLAQAPQKTSRLTGITVPATTNSRAVHLLRVCVRPIHSPRPEDKARQSATARKNAFSIGVVSPGLSRSPPE